MSNIIDKIQVSGVTYDISGGGIPESAFTAYTAATDSRISEDEEVTSAGLNALNGKFDTKVDASTYSAYTAATDTALSGKADTATTYTKTEVDNAITAATSTKQDTLVSGTNIKTINNESILGSGNIDIQGGGKAISGGTNISVTTGETADTINCTLPISFGLKNTSLSFFGSNNANNYYTCAFGYGNNVFSTHSYAFGIYNENRGNNTLSSGSHNKIQQNSTDSVAFGFNNRTSNDSEFVSGNFNVSNTGSTDADKTLFSVGNGTADNARHNAFEIRKNGDIYITSGGTDIKLQDNLGGGGSSYTAGDGIDITNDVISVTGKVSTSDFNTYSGTVETRLTEDEEVTAAGLNAVNDKFDGLKLKKLTQVEYDALTTKDSNTLYIVI